MLNTLRLRLDDDGEGLGFMRVPLNPDDGAAVVCCCFVGSPRLVITNLASWHAVSPLLERQSGVFTFDAKNGLKIGRFQMAYVMAHMPNENRAATTG